MTGQCGQALPVLENYRFPLNLKSNRNLQDKKHTHWIPLIIFFSLLVCIVGSLNFRCKPGELVGSLLDNSCKMIDTAVFEV